MKTKSKARKPVATARGTAGKPPTATPRATGTTRTSADVATVRSDRKGRRAAVARAIPATVTIQPAIIRRAQPSSPTPCSVRGPPPGTPSGRLVKPPSVRIVSGTYARASTGCQRAGQRPGWRRMNDLMCARLHRDGGGATTVAAPSDRSAPVVLRWPSDPARRRELADLGVPRLLLVDSDAPPPICTDPLE